MVLNEVDLEKMGIYMDVDVCLKVRLKIQKVIVSLDYDKEN
jgi:hypothetical protein